MAPNAAPFTDDALAKVAVPVRVYAAENDDLTLVRYHAERLVRALPQAECVLVKGAGHFSFIASFPPTLKIIAGEGARDPDGFDRDALHEVMNREIVEFFNRTLRPAGNAPIKGAQPPSCRSRASSGLDFRPKSVLLPAGLDGAGRRQRLGRGKDGEVTGRGPQQGEAKLTVADSGQLATEERGRRAVTLGGLIFVDDAHVGAGQ
jgi:hypothetical protein